MVVLILLRHLVERFVVWNHNIFQALIKVQNFWNLKAFFTRTYRKMSKFGAQYSASMLIKIPWAKATQSNRPFWFICIWELDELMFQRTWASHCVLSCKSCTFFSTWPFTWTCRLDLIIKCVWAPPPSQRLTASKCGSCVCSTILACISPATSCLTYLRFI